MSSASLPARPNRYIIQPSTIYCTSRTSIMADNFVATTVSPQEWKPQAREWLVMITLALISLMVALDATILVPIIPVQSDLFPRTVITH